MPYYTHQKYKGTDYYLCIDEFSNCFVAGMTYYTLHRYNGAHQYTCVYVLSDGSVDRMPNYILHMNMHAHSYIVLSEVVITFMSSKAGDNEWKGL